MVYVPTYFETYLLTGEFLILRVLAHLEPYFQIQHNLVKELTSMISQTNNTCRKLRVSAFQRLWSGGCGQSLHGEILVGAKLLRL